MICYARPDRNPKSPRNAENRAKRTLCLLTACLLAASAAGCGTSKKADVQKPFRVGLVTFAGYAPFYLAQTKGLFGDLKVEFKRIEEVPSLRAAITRRDLDAYLATPDIAQDTNSAPPGRAVWAIDESAGGDGVVVAPSVGDTVTSLRGRDVAAEPGLPPNFLLLYFLYKNDMSLKDVHFKDMSTQNAATAFASGTVDAAGIYEPYLTQAREKRVGSKVVLSSKDLPGVIVDLIFAREDLVAAHDPRVSQLIGGWRKAVHLIKAQPEVAYPIMANAFGLPLDQFRATVGGIRWLDLDDNRRLYGTVQQPGPMISAFKEVSNVLRKNRPEVYQAAASDYLVRSYLEAEQ